MKLPSLIAAITMRLDTLIKQGEISQKQHQQIIDSLDVIKATLSKGK
mgnify:FL=1